MPENTGAAVDFPVRVHFRQKDPKTGKSVTYDPNGDYDEDTGLGWPGAKAVYSGVPGSDEVKHLQDGADSHHGPLIGDPIPQDDAPSKDDAPAKSTTSRAASSAKTDDTKES